MILLNISEEYGYDQWYAVISEDRYQELKNEWQTIKGLNCLVPVRFLIPEALNFPLRPEHAQFSDPKYIESSGAQIVDAHIHQWDDSFLQGVDYDIPEGEFSFKGKTYSEEEVNKIFHEYRDEDNKRLDELDAAQVPDHLGFGLNITEIYDWPEDVPLPAGWIRTKDRILKDSSSSSHD